MGPATRYTPRRNTASIMKIFLILSIIMVFVCRFGKAQCEIPIRKFKKMSDDAVAHLSSYTMVYCKSKEEILEENLEKVRYFHRFGARFGYQKCNAFFFTS